MPPRNIGYAQDCFYHFYNRGVNRQEIFIDEANYLYLLNLLRKYSRMFRLSIISYCLMPNHYHFLVRQDGGFPAGLLPQRVFNAYSKAFNKRYNRTGALFESRYKAILVDRNEYLIHLCRYIHANPVKAGKASGLEEWPHSNYLEWVGERNQGLVDYGFVREFFPNLREYKRFVLDYLSDADELPAGMDGYIFDE